MIDFHCHILPNVDDGSRSVKESIAMLQLQAEQGIGKVVATPHFYADYDSPERFLRRRRESEVRLREAIADHSGLPQLAMGAEVHFFSGMSATEILPELAIAGKTHILVEMPHVTWTETMYRELEAISENHGLTPIIAHVDRYIGPLRTHGIPERLEELPVLVQANAGFFLDRWTSGMALRMLRKGQIHLLGSDCHNMDHRRPNLGPAAAVIRQKLGKEYLHRLHTCEQQVWSGAEV